MLVLRYEVPRAAAYRLGAIILLLKLTMRNIAKTMGCECNSRRVLCQATYVLVSGLASTIASTPFCHCLSASTSVDNGFDVVKTRAAKGTQKGKLFTLRIMHLTLPKWHPKLQNPRGFAGIAHPEV